MNIRKKVAATVAALMAAVLTLSSCGTSAVTPYGVASHGQSNLENAQQQEIKESAFVTIDINPSIELVINREHTVTSVRAANTDAEIMLWNEDSIVGKNIEDAIAAITAMAVDMGYLNEENTNVSVTVTTTGGKTEQELLTVIDTAISETVKQSGLEVKVEQATDLVLTKELERVKRENEGKPGYSSLTLSRYRLVKAALKADRELTMDIAVQMSNENLTETVNSAQIAAAEKIDETCAVAMSEAEFNYENAKQTLLDSAYTAVYAARLNLSSLFANYGAMYASYRLAYRTIEHYGETLLQLIENPIFTSDDVFALANALGIDTSIETEYDAFKQAITDKNGDITRDSVNAYINAQYKKLDAEERAKLEEAYDAVTELLDELEAEASVITKEGYAIINAALLGLNISVEVKTYEDIPALLEAIQQKIDSVWTKMETDLTENEKASALERQEKMAKEIAEQEQAFAEAVARAKQEAEERLNRAKESRGNAYGHTNGNNGNGNGGYKGEDSNSGNDKNDNNGNKKDKN